MIYDKNPIHCDTVSLRGRIKEGGTLQRLDYVLHDTVHVSQYIVIPEPQDNETLIPQPSIPLGIIIGLLSMLPAVQLDDQPFFQTDKIDNVLSQWLLATEFETLDLPKTKFSPEQPLGVGGVFPQLPGPHSYLVHTPILTFPRKGERNWTAQAPRMTIVVSNTAPPFTQLAP
jgi:hypothetical protein